MRLIAKLRREPERATELVVPVRASVPSITGRVMGLLALPVPVEWSQRILPAGAYVFVASPAGSPSWVYVRGSEEASVFPAASSEPSADSPRSEIALRYDGRRYHVGSLTLREAGTTLRFDVRGSKPVGRQERRRSGVPCLPLRPLVEDLAVQPCSSNRHGWSAVNPGSRGGPAEAPLLNVRPWRIR